MSTQRSRLTSFSSEKTRAERIRAKAQKLRERVRASQAAFIERRERYLAWWQQAFRRPLVGYYGWIFSRAASMWAAMMTLIGWQPRGQAKMGQIASKRRNPIGGKAAFRGLLCEGLESRQLMAVLGVTANDTFVQEDPGGSPLPNNGQFTVSTDGAATVVAFTLTGTANSEFGTDYNATDSNGSLGASGNLTIPAGTTEWVVDIDVADDNLYDGGNETVILTVSTFSDTMSIVDNETAPNITISASDASATENPVDPGQYTVNFVGSPSDTNTTVVLTPNSGNPATVAVSGTDYTAWSSPVTIAAGATSTTVAVTPIDDSLVEQTETVTATLGTISGNTGITLNATKSAVVNIADDPDSATVSIGAFAPAIGEPSGKSTAYISQTGVASTPTVVKFTLQPSSTALLDTDYTLGESDEVESNNTVAGPQPLTNGPQGLAGFALSANANITNATTVPHVTINSTAGTNTATNKDVYAFYTSTGGASTFDIDNTSGFNSFLTLYDANGNVLATNDNNSTDAGSPVAASNTDSFISFTLGGAGVYYIEVAKGSTAAGTVSNTGTVGDIPVGSAYKLHVSVPGATGYAVIGAGSTSVPLSVTVIDDSLLEPTETVNVRLDSITVSDPDISFLSSNPANASRNASVSITDDDTATVSIAGTTNALEPSTNGLFTITQTKQSSTETRIPYTVSGTAKTTVTGTVTDPADHKLLSGTITIPAGSTQTTLTVEVIDSALIEEDETVIVTLGAPISPTDADVSIGTGVAQILIGDEDTAKVDVDATVAPAVEGTSTGKFTFFLSEPPGYPTGKPAVSDRDTVIQYSIGGTAINGTDYAPLSGLITIPAFSSSTFITIDPTGPYDDLLLEGTETVSVTIVNLLTPTDSNIGIGAGSPSDSMTITDNDALTVKVVSTSDALEGTAPPPGVFTFSTSGTGTTLVPTIVTYQVKVSSSTAVEGTDFQTLTGTVTIPAGAAPQSATVLINASGPYDDILFEGNETVTLEILSVSGGPNVVEDPVFGEATGQIIDDETGLVTITKKLDGAEGSVNDETNGEFTVTLGGASALPTVVELQVLPSPTSTATPGSDYTALTSKYLTLTFNPFVTSLPVPIDVLDDGISEGTETVVMKVKSVLSGPYTPSPSTATVNIYSDQKVGISADDPLAAEPSNNGSFVVSLYTPGVGPTTSNTNTVVNLKIATGAGQATNGTDYTSIPLVVTIPAGSTTAAIPVSVIDDLTLEGSETVTVTLTSIASGNGDITVDGSNNSDTVTIADNDAAYLTVATTKNPGQDNPGSDVDGEFTITMSQPSDTNTVVKFTISGTATSGSDYTSIPLSATILANQTQVVIPVDVINDNIVEGTENVVIKLTSPVTSPYAANIFLGALGATYAGPGLAQLSFRDGVNSYNSTSDTYLDQFNPALIQGLQGDVFVGQDTGLLNAAHGLLRFDNIVGTGNGQVPLGSKLSAASVNLNAFNSGDLSVHEMLQSWNELVNTWANSFGANGVQANGVEAASAGSNFFLGFGANSLSSALLLSTIQGWINGSANNGLALLPATANSTDVFSSDWGGVAVRPELALTLDVSATLDIIDTDTATVSVIGSNAASEPATTGSLVVGLSSPASSNVVVHYADLLSGSATSGSDYVAIPAGSVTILAGQTTATIAVAPNNDSLVEFPETVNLQITGLTVTDPQITLGSPSAGTVTINDNDFAIVSISGTTNGDENVIGTPGLPPIPGSFVVSMSTPSSVDTVLAVTVGGSATSGSDYVAIPALITIPANFLSTTVPVTVIDDLINEAAVETVTLTLNSVTAGNLAKTAIGAPGSGTVNIADDEQTLTVKNVAVKAVATEGGPNGEFQFQLNFPSDKPTVITYQVLGSSTATAAPNALSPDYNASALPGSTGPTYTTGTVTIAAGATTAALPVIAFQDYVAEGPETVDLQITSVSNPNTALIGVPTATVTINDVVYTVSVVKTDSPASEPGPPSGSNGQFTFSITAPLPEPTIVKYSIGGTASPTIDPFTGVADYKALSGTLTIPANQTSVVLSVDVIDDLLVESTETVIVTLTSASSTGPSYVYGAPTVGVDATPATETIDDNDSSVVSIAGVDGSEAGQPAVSSDGKFVISQTNISATNTVVTYAVQGSSTATNGTDYTSISGTLTATILAGQTSVVVPVDILDDTIVEPTETVVMKLLATKSPTDPQVTIGTNLATVNITDDDSATVSLLATGPIGFEPGTNDGQYTLFLSNKSATDTVVTYAIDPSGDATFNSDYVIRDAALKLLSGTVTIPAGQTSTTMVVDVLDDNIIENNETVVVGLTGTNNAKISASPTKQTVTIQDFGSADQDLGKVTVTKLVDGDENFGGPAINGKFLLTLVPTNPFYNVANGPFSSDENTVVTYQILGSSTALNPSDHTLPLTGTATIPAGQTTAIITVPVVDDTTAEAPETLDIQLTGTLAPTHAAITVDSTPATIAMLDDDISVLVITDVTKAENTPPSGGNVMKFVVTSPNAVAGGFSVNFTVTDVTTGKFGGADYTVTTVSPLVFAGTAGETQVISITTNPDNMVEADETFTVSLSSASPLVDASDTGTGTITNDDQAQFKITDVTVTEGTSGNPSQAPFTVMNFTLSVSNPIDQNTTVDVDFTDLTAFGGDFDPLLALAPPNNKIPVAVSGFDYDNDAGESSPNVSQYTFPAGSTTSQTVQVRVTQDNIVEGGTSNNPGSETFQAVPTVVTTGRNTVVVTSSGFNGTGTITDDDSATVSISAVDNKASEPFDTVNEGNGRFVVTQTAVSSSDTVIKYTVGGTATPSGVSATEDDYTKLSGTVTIPAGSTTAAIDVLVLDNPLLEIDETVIVTLTGFVSRDPNVSLSGTLSDTVTIFDDDQATVSIKANDPNAAEDPVPDNGQFTLTLSGVSVTDTVVLYSIAGGPGTATNGADYTTLSGTATIPAGQTTTTIDVAVLQDVVVEGAETVTLTLTGFVSPTNADIKIGTPTDTVTIADDFDGIKVSVATNGNGSEGTPPSNGSFIVRITKDDGVTPVPAPAGGMQVLYSSVGGTATPGAGGDYIGLSGVLFIPAGQTTGVIDVGVNDDSLVEPTETVVVTLQTLLHGPFPGGEPASIGTPAATVNILDDDVAVFTVDDLVVNEGDGTGTLTVKLNKPMGNVSVPVTVNYVPLTAGSPSDFAPLGSQTVTFAPGDTTPKTVTFSIVDDALIEGIEGFGVTLSTTFVTGPGLEQIDVNDTAVVGITDNDATTLVIEEVKVGGAGWTPAFNDFIDNTGAPVGQRGYSIPSGASQTAILPWVNLNQIFVKFNQDPDPATLIPANFVLFGLQGPSTPSVTTVVYDTATNLAKLTLSGNIINDRLRLQVKDAVTLAGNPLDGEWVDGVSSFASGDGTAGGNFNFQFQVLPGDVNRSGAVLSGDANLAFAAINAFTDGTSAFSAPNGNTYTIFKDLNGSGTITSADASLAFARLGFPANVIPAGTPGSLSGSSSASSSVDSVDSILSQFQGWQANSSASSSSELVTDDPATAIAEDKPVDTDLVDQLIVDLADGLL